MKNAFSKVILLALLVPVTSLSYAQDRLSSTSEYKAKVTEPFAPKIAEEGESLRLLMEFDNPNNERVYIAIRNIHGEVFSQSLRDRKIVKRYDLSNLDDGEYYLEITKGKQHFTKTIRIYTNTLIIRTVE
jgi:hypothetical protein